MTRKGFNWRAANRRQRTIEQNIQRKFQRPIPMGKIAVKPAVPPLKLPPMPPQGEKK